MSVSSASYVRGATCVVCGKEYSPRQLSDYVCPDHGTEGILDICYDYVRAQANFPDASQPGLWRYRALLPLPLNAAVPPLYTGMTPLYPSSSLAGILGLHAVFIKDDSREPTASFKDRASCLAVAQAMEQAMPAVATASTGNAAAALAGMAASVEMPCIIFVPASAPPAKIAQLQAYGATIFLVEGSYDQAFDLCMEACERMGWYNRNTGYNPAMAEGKKTAAFEICEQLEWLVPDAVFVGVGDGCIIAGLHKGFKELVHMGRITHMPRLYGVQAHGSDFMFQAWEEGRFTPEALLKKAPIHAHTAADSIAAGLPRDRIKAMDAVRSTKGCFIRVTDEEILAATPILARTTGVFAEPAAAAALAGLQSALHNTLVQAQESVCLVITGSGLKDTAALAGAPSVASALIRIQPDQNALDAVLPTLSLQPTSAS